jgi:hypothetical protein
LSVGLARGLTGVGLLWLNGRQWLQDAPGVTVVSRSIPAGSALVMRILGMGMTVEAVWRLVS